MVVVVVVVVEEEEELPAFALVQVLRSNSLDALPTSEVPAWELVRHAPGKLGESGGLCHRRINDHCRRVLLPAGDSTQP